MKKLSLHEAELTIEHLDELLGQVYEELGEENFHEILDSFQVRNVDEIPKRLWPRVVRICKSRLNR